MLKTFLKKIAVRLPGLFSFRPRAVKARTEERQVLIAGVRRARVIRQPLSVKNISNDVHPAKPRSSAR
jgi:hypothetical protein